MTPDLITPYIASLQKLAMESELQGFSGLANGSKGLLMHEVMRLWLDSNWPSENIRRAGRRMVNVTQQATRQPALPCPLAFRAGTGPVGS